MRVCVTTKRVTRAVDVSGTRNEATVRKIKSFFDTASSFLAG
jgi:hypothetical protein